MIESGANGRHYREDSLGRFFALALGVHVLFVGAFAALSLLLGLEFFSSEKYEDIELIQSAVRVDVVAMPKLTVQELKNMEPQAPAADTEDEAPKAADAQASSEVEFKTEKKVELSSLLSSLSSRKVEKAKKRKDQKDKGPALSAKELNSLVMEGNKVSKGQALVGDSLGAAQSDFADYVAAIPGHIRPFWKLPSYLLEKELKARIRVFISENGKIIKTQIYESSGVAEFDRRALEALNKAGILPVPEKSIRSRLAAGQVVLGFPL